MITHCKLNVTTLSAISANLGTVNAGNISGVTITGSTITGGTINAGPSNAIVINSAGIALPDGTSVSGYRIKMGNAEIWGSGGAGGFYVSGGLFAYGQIGTDSNVFCQGNVIIGNSGAIQFGALDSQNAGIGRPLVAASDGIVHGVGNGVSGTYSGFTFENGICTGHP